MAYVSESRGIRTDLVGVMQVQEYAIYIRPNEAVDYVRHDQMRVTSASTALA